MSGIDQVHILPEIIEESEISAISTKDNPSETFKTTDIAMSKANKLEEELKDTAVPAGEQMLISESVIESETTTDVDIPSRGTKRPAEESVNASQKAGKEDNKEEVEEVVEAMEEEEEDVAATDGGELSRCESRAQTEDNGLLDLNMDPELDAMDVTDPLPTTDSSNIDPHILTDSGKISSDHVSPAVVSSGMANISPPDSPPSSSSSPPSSSVRDAIESVWSSRPPYADNSAYMKPRPYKSRRVSEPSVYEAARRKRIIQNERSVARKKLEMMLFLEQVDCHMRMLAARKASENRKVVEGGEGGERGPGRANSVKQEDDDGEDKMDCTVDELFNPHKAEGEAFKRARFRRLGRCKSMPHISNQEVTTAVSTTMALGLFV
ncbi:uncharacterized protein H6S33_002201 [Morchella sextelata]|uniref:uncharacterized protein n=1 Tax=Morchella sextelata TaxID=1174677 RepID=UPI001D03F9B1|nr:uncharacterized protein H6S33_002201 [Morchella sextelata]KAH0608149.1 hypothetical protein H6S33_002201 [Morchella sextelata]